MVIRRREIVIEESPDSMKVEEPKEEEKVIPEIRKVEIVSAPQATPGIPGLELSNEVEIYEVIHYEIKAKNKPDARRALEFFVSSQDKILSLNSVSKGYVAIVHRLVMRDGW